MFHGYCQGVGFLMEGWVSPSDNWSHPLNNPNHNQLIQLPDHQLDSAKKN